MADADAKLVLDLLALPRGASVLDVPCGDGRLTVRFAAAGYTAIGVDLAEDELELARAAGADARFVAGGPRGRSPPRAGGPGRGVGQLLRHPAPRRHRSLACRDA